MGTSIGRLVALTGAALALALAGCSAESSGSGSAGGAGDGYAVPPGAHEGAPPAYGPIAPGASDDTGAPGVPLPPGSFLTDPAADPLSTFALDVDTGSYTRFRDAVQRGVPVAPYEVRTEEFVNFFEQDYPVPEEGLDVVVDGARLPFDPSRAIVRVGIRSADVSAEARPDADLTLVVDCSGSMQEAGKMELTKSALRILVRSLRPTDRVAMVCYSETAQVTLPPTTASDQYRVMGAIEALRPDASTNAAAGLGLGYELARSMQGEGRMARVVLISDGVANVGATTSGGILEQIGDAARDGIHLVSVGVGIADYNDHLLEQLADKGDGWHVYVDDLHEAERLFGHELTESLVVTAREAKAQVEFDPEQVAGYRLVGYENRAVADEDFRDDTVDGGEVLAGHATTALYEVRLRGSESRGSFVAATVRYLDDGGRPVERRRELSVADVVPDVRVAAPRLQQDVVVAMVADRLRGGPWASALGSSDLRAHVAYVAARLPQDGDVAELARLVDQARL